MAVNHFAKKFAFPAVAHAPTYPVQTVTHQQRVCRLYKRLYRMKEAQSYNRGNFIVWRTLLRHQIDQNKDVKDERQANRLIEMGEQELKRIHVDFLYKFPDSPGGVAWDRYDHYPNDVVLEEWDDAERAMYPDYFNKRTQRLWEHKEWAKLKLAEYDAYFEQWKKENPDLYQDYKWMFEPPKRYVSDHYHIEDHH
ncbi:NADH dehydrogenase [ubiquinone] 1 beta subcomplex subunit 9-like isoform X3 [Convolutriloba macropyga]|uniref:NADH dehydrogenase [ubiquinone] 1 beta subcomplex subunit 9-like isoform X3 n=1 Tax=Convolutriloba macropyga TaxID=536237 RepID=UPI003F52755F